MKKNTGEYALNGTVDVYVELPGNYYENEDKNYAVCYVLDGNKLGKDSDAFGIHQMYSVYGETMPEIIFVGITHPSDSYRSGVFAPPMDTTFFLCDQARGDVDTKLNGVGDYYFQWMADFLKPYIDERYRTKKEAEYTGIVGHSSGASGAMIGAMMESDTFSRVGAFSPATWMWENWFFGQYQIVDIVITILRQMGQRVIIQ